MGKHSGKVQREAEGFIIITVSTDLWAFAVFSLDLEVF